MAQYQLKTGVFVDEAGQNQHQIRGVYVNETLAGDGSPPAIFAPATDIATFKWRSTAPAYAPTLKEPVASDASFVISPDLLAAVPLVLSLPAPRSPGTYTARYRQRRTGATGDSRLVFMSAGNVDVGATPWTAAGAAFGLHTVAFTLTGVAIKFRIEVRP